MPTIADAASLTVSLPARGRGRRVALVTSDDAHKKAHGIHYTPPLLAAYLARQVVRGLKGRRETPADITVLDPACGEGELLKAVVEAVPAAWRRRLSLTGFDKDDNAMARARIMLTDVGVRAVDLRCADFLSVAAATGADPQMDLGFVADIGPGPRLDTQFDAVISNPPYVRTQVLGSAVARELALRFELTGRVDLYHAFVKAMTLVLREGGMLGLLTSNRFLSVQSGSSMREWLASHYDLMRLVDLGDTKLFEAAVLPAIVVARRNASNTAESRDHSANPHSPSEGEWECLASSASALPLACEFIRVYETTGEPQEKPREAGSILETLDGSFSGLACVNDTCFRVETGTLQTGADGRSPWSMRNRGIDAWLATVKSHSDGIFSDVAKVCVGIKTTADSVFIRDNWEKLPVGERPEDELLHPLVTHHLAERWHLPADAAQAKRVLYPYEMASEQRTPVNLSDYPRARAYLLKHRTRLEGRNYVIESGRQWYEIWVPHRPRDWTLPKLAFPDISERSKFFLVEQGWIVNGDCYWTKLLPGKHVSWLLLMLAVANSSFAMKFYDAVFHNKLYSGRRRFMSQYVSRFPLPNMSRAKGILDLMPRLVEASSQRKISTVERHQRDLDELVWRAFGLSKEIAR